MTSDPFKECTMLQDSSIICANMKGRDKTAVHR